MKKRDIRKEELQRYWHAHVLAWRESGLSCQGYAHRHGLYKNAIRYWGRKFPADASPALVTGTRSITLQTKIAPAPSGAQRSEVKFVPLDLSSKMPDKPKESLVLRVGSRFRIDVPNQFSQTVLVRLLRALEMFS